jgi:general secretion pathway protein H
MTRMGGRQGAVPAGARGVTLLELIIVLALIALLLAVVPPLISGGAASAQLKAGARQLAAGLRRVRSTAITLQREAVLNLDVDEHSFKMTGDERQYPLPKDVELSLYTAESELAGESVGAIRFFPDGSSTGGRITLAAGERHFLVDVDWLTGRVSVTQ